MSNVLLSMSKKVIKLTIKEAATHFSVSPVTIRRRIKSSKLQAEKVGNQWFVHVEQSTNQSEQKVNQPDQSTLIKQQQSEIEHLREQIESLSQQLDHVHQLLAVSQKSIQQLTEQNQLLLEHKRKPFWQRLFQGRNQ